MTRRTTPITAMLAAVAFAGPALAADNFAFSNQTVGFDRWMYDNNAAPGFREFASVFANFDGSTDERLGQFVIGIDTAAQGIPTDLDPAEYNIHALSVTATHTFGSFVYDPTYDSFNTYLDGGPADSDAGRPIVLTGVGLRNGFTELSFGAATAGPPAFEEGEAFGGAGPGQRNTFAAAFDASGNLIDISNNVDAVGNGAAGFNFNPWAVGTTNLNPGDTVDQASGSSPGSTFTFDLTAMLADPFVEQYLRESLAAGQLFFAITSLHETTITGGSNPRFFTTDDFSPFAVFPTISLDVTIGAEASVIPAPAAFPAGLALLALGALRRARRRTPNPTTRRV